MHRISFPKLSFHLFSSKSKLCCTWMFKSRPVCPLSWLNNMADYVTKQRYTWHNNKTHYYEESFQRRKNEPNHGHVMVAGGAAHSEFVVLLLVISPWDHICARSYRIHAKEKHNMKFYKFSFGNTSAYLIYKEW